jgi:hypothetical protein
MSIQLKKSWAANEDGRQISVYGENISSCAGNDAAIAP